MIPVCPFAGASRPDDVTLTKPYDENKQQAQENKPRKESGEAATVSPKCLFGYDSTLKRPCDNQNKQQFGQEGKPKQEFGESATVSPKCPFGYDSTIKKPCDDQNKQQDGQEGKPKQEFGESATVSLKCPLVMILKHSNWGLLAA